MWGGKWVLQGFALFLISAAKRNQRLWWVHRGCSPKYHGTHWIPFPSTKSLFSPAGAPIWWHPEKNISNLRDFCTGITGKAFPVQLSLDGAEQGRAASPTNTHGMVFQASGVMGSTGNGNPPHQNGNKILCQLNNRIYSLIIHLVSALTAGMVCAKWSLALQEAFPYKLSSFNYFSLSCFIRKSRCLYQPFKPINNPEKIQIIL